jgi:subtilisin family serine protease
VRKKRAFLAAITVLLILAPLLTPNETILGTATPAVPLTIRGVRPPAGPISVFIESEHDLNPEEVRLLSSFGTITTVTGPIAVLHTQVASLPAIERLPFLTRIEGAHSLSVDLDRSVPDVGAPVVWNEVKDQYGRNVTGAGVIIGFVDTGIDTTHPDFTFPNGTTKILYVWDQMTAGRPPTGFDYGYECTSADIQTRRCPEIDTFGHGTPVAGISARSVKATGNYTGVAPDANIIFVKSGHSVCDHASWTFDSSQILDGINYIVKKAAPLHKRLVVNLSLGGNIGGHDGTDPLERGLDAFVKAGTPIVVSAGNSARDHAHIRGQLSQGKNVSFQIEVMGTTTDVQMDVWYSLQDQIEAELTTPDGQSYSVPTPPGGTAGSYGNVTTLATTSDYGREVYLEVNSTASLPRNGWSVTLKANQVQSQGFWDAWVDTSTCSFPGAFFVPGDGYEIDANDTIGFPGTARYVVTVGAYITKTSWKGMNGATFGRTDIRLGDIASFSSRGPTRDGRIKPDVVAPGELITSARSNATLPHDGDPDAYHRILAGTSMAAPHVAGTIALMLQYAPTLQATEIPGILRQTARLDAHTGVLATESPTWGYGKVDARTATGLSRLTLVTSGIPDTINVTVRIDGSQTQEVAGGSWVDLYFVKGTTHTVSSDTELQAGPGARYVAESGTFVVSNNSLKMLNYTTQYLLTVTSQHGTTTGQGWYNANTTVRISAPARIAAPGVLGYIGAEYVLAYWVTADGSVISDHVVMNAPRTITAVYLPTLPVQILGMVILIAATAVLSVVLLARRYMS